MIVDMFGTNVMISPGYLPISHCYEQIEFVMRDIHRGSDWLLGYTCCPKPQGGGINLRRYKQASTVIRIIPVPRRVGGRCIRGTVTKRDCVNRGLTISEGARADRWLLSTGGEEINFERSWPRGIESPRKSLAQGSQSRATKRNVSKRKKPFTVAAVFGA